MNIKELIEVSEEMIKDSMLCKECNRKLCICKGEKYERIIKCCECGKNLKYKNFLRHFREVHKKEKRSERIKKFIKGQGKSFVKINCELCEKSVLGKNLKRHKERFHNE